MDWPTRQVLRSSWRCFLDHLTSASANFRKKLNRADRLMAPLVLRCCKPTTDPDFTLRKSASKKLLKIHSTAQLCLGTGRLGIFFVSTTLAGRSRPSSRCFRLARLVSSCHDTFSTRPSHGCIHTAPETVSQSCCCDTLASVWLVLTCVIWSVHGQHGVLGIALPPSCWGLGLSIRTDGCHLAPQGQQVVCCPLVRKVWPGHLPKVKKKVHWVSFLGDGQSGFACYF